MKQDHIQNGVLPRYFPSEQLTLCAQTDVHFKLLYFSLQKKMFFTKLISQEDALYLLIHILIVFF